jgi:hypothetical protein
MKIIEIQGIATWGRSSGPTVNRLKRKDRGACPRLMRPPPNAAAPRRPKQHRGYPPTAEKQGKIQG